MQMRAQAQYYGLRWAGIGLLIVGVFLVLAGIAYYGNLYWLRSNVDDYVGRRQDTVRLAPEAAPQAPPEGRIISAWALQPDAYANSAESWGFTSLPQSGASPLGALAPASRLVVPELGIDVKLDRASLTGSDIVAQSSAMDGPGLDTLRANPGERGAMWFFGDAGQHANNFGGLTRAAGLFSRGEDILIFVDNGSTNYVYAATHSDVFRASDLRISGSERATIHLVVPVPSGLYDHFLVLSGELVGVK